MGTVARLAGVLVFGLFVSVIALRPIVQNPAISGALRDGPAGWGMLAVAPLVLVALFVVALRLHSLTDDDTDPHEEQYSVATGERANSFWDERKQDDPTGTNPTDSTADQRTDWTDEHPDTPGGGWDVQGDSPDSAGGERPDTAAEGESDGTDGESEAESQQTQDRPNILSGQGGTREREFEIEDEPPDAMLSDHLEHLQAQLADDETVAEDLDTLEEVAHEVEGDRTIPARCPQDHCNAVWTGRTVLGVGTEQYAVLEDGKRVQCLNCEEIVTLE